MRTRLFVLVLSFALAFPAVGQEIRRAGKMPVVAGVRAPAFGPLPILNRDGSGRTHLTFDGPAADDGRVVLISFFALWCAGCVNEMPMLAELQRSYGERGLQVITVDIDPAGADLSRLRSLLSASRVTYPVVADPEQGVLRQYQGQMTSLPAVYLVGPDGRVELVHEGFDSEVGPRLKALLDRLLPPQHAERNLD
jgi:thiol-disulfide isomerase/thioredoxin